MLINRTKYTKSTLGTIQYRQSYLCEWQSYRLNEVLLFEKKVKIRSSIVGGYEAKDTCY